MRKLGLIFHPHTHFPLFPSPSMALQEVLRTTEFPLTLLPPPPPPSLVVLGVLTLSLTPKSQPNIAVVKALISLSD